MLTRRKDEGLKRSEQIVQPFFAYLTGNPNSTCHNLSCCHRERSEEPSATEIA